MFASSDVSSAKLSIFVWDLNMRREMRWEDDNDRNFEFRNNVWTLLPQPMVGSPLDRVEILSSQGITALSEVDEVRFNSYTMSTKLGTRGAFSGL
eukprot:UN23888